MIKNRWLLLKIQNLQPWWRFTFFIGGWHFLRKGSHKIVDDQNVGNHEMITDSVFILFKKTDFITILTCLGGKVYRWWVSHKIFAAEMGVCSFIDQRRLFVNLGPPFRRKCQPPHILQHNCANLSPQKQTNKQTKTKQKQKQNKKNRKNRKKKKQQQQQQHCCTWHLTSSLGKEMLIEQSGN